MGDIICRNCGEPWDSYGARHGGDMDNREYRMLISGKGCPSCKGQQLYDCIKYTGIYVPYKLLDISCEKGKWLKWGMTCTYPLDDCQWKQKHPKPDDIEFLSSVADNTDDMEALDAAMNIEFEEKRK